MMLVKLKNRFTTKMTTLTNLIQFVRGRSHPVFLDYKVDLSPRYGYGKPPHPLLYDIINENREGYRLLLNAFLQFTEQLIQIPVYKREESKPSWINGFLPGLDSVSLYGLLALNNPVRYFEIGSGNSTKFARKAIDDYGLRTRIVSIDPHPRAEIDSLCDRIIREPVENVDISVFDELETGDILFVDNSHRAFTNSDATVTFLDILPRLKQGVIVEFHDIFLPYDYTSSFAKRWYSEQYLLACFLLAGGNRIEVLLPNMFICNDEELSILLTPLWERPELRGVERHGGSFWIRMR